MDTHLHRRFILDEITEMKRYLSDMYQKIDKCRNEILNDWVMNHAEKYRKEWFLKNDAKMER